MPPTGRGGIPLMGMPAPELITPGTTEPLATGTSTETRDSSSSFMDFQKSDFDSSFELPSRSPSPSPVDVLLDVSPPIEPPLTPPAPEAEFRELASDAPTSRVPLKDAEE